MKKNSCRALHVYIKDGVLVYVVIYFAIHTTYYTVAIFEICQNLTNAAFAGDPEAASLFIGCPNSRSQTGSDRNKLILNPSCVISTQLQHCRVLGQLMGIAVRSNCCLDLVDKPIIPVVIAIINLL